MAKKKHAPLSRPGSVEPFLLLPENQLAYTALKNLAASSYEEKGRIVYIYGASGTGKTHLGESFLQEVERSLPEMASLSYTASQFAAEYAEAVESKTIDLFREPFSELDLFICEDIAALENRRSTVQLLTTVIDRLYHSGGRILLTSRKAPRELKGVSPQLINRCHSGACIKLSLPGISSRKELLGHFANVDNWPISTAVRDMLAESLEFSPRELRGVLVQLKTEAKLKKKLALDHDFVRRFIADQIKPGKPSLAQITRVVAKQFGVSVAAIRSRQQTVDITQPRQCAMFLARDLTDLSLRHIADYFGRRNHSTVIHACHRFQELLNQEPRLQYRFHQIRDAVGAEESPV